MKTTLYGVAAIVALVITVGGGRPSSAQDKDKKDKQVECTLQVRQRN